MDLQGYVLTGRTGYVPVKQTRIVDTRTGLGLPHARLVSTPASGHNYIQVTGRAAVGTPVPVDGVTGAVVVITVVSYSASSDY